VEGAILVSSFLRARKIDNAHLSGKILMAGRSPSDGQLRFCLNLAGDSHYSELWAAPGNVPSRTSSR
jgi:hypothetical protein